MLRRTIFGVLIVAFAAAFIAVPFLTAQQDQEKLSPGDDAPAFKLKTLEDEAVSLEDIKKAGGGYLVFFTTWCPHCIKEVPHINKVKADAEKADEKLVVYGVNVRQPKRAVQRFAKAKEAGYPILLDADAAVAMAYKVRGVPTIVGIDAEGKVTYLAHVFPKDFDEAKKELE